MHSAAKSTAFAVACLALLSQVATVLADVAINNPVEGTQWTAGQTTQVTWLPGPNGITPNKDVAIELMHGDNPDQLDLVGVIGRAKESDQRATVNVPSGLTSGGYYAVRIGDRYSHYFHIIGSGKPGSSSGSGSSSSGSSSGKPTSTTDSSSSTTTTSSSKTSSTSTPSKTPIRMPSSGAATVAPTDQPLVLASSLLALVPVAVLAIWGF
ncbi:hypothetical protein SYNPS1DRAFT_25626 [Syncephalis pseudoplumigaleata]|uniref:Yeast cell wall synthesis Kre9/Knh1-like N-terminal domain-containing protein n=1 Tax=Syncephalis pseudoplumigaleata TaxID=1712513 RepID=A0A4P9YSA7_9FUNG|nr:hypothetical protein SYNPS1DRAFT_25626 [Syncephalis pseudoplumigaleata]|eukprot:RKP22585.1 hypothetical protein SYNPS1DRAFT_25626 [Syncephalis pseudoplumigaleata]